MSGRDRVRARQWQKSREPGRAQIEIVSACRGIFGLFPATRAATLSLAFPVSPMNRRNFLRAAGTAAALATLPRGLAQWQPSPRYPDPAIKIIDPSFAGFTVETKNDAIYTGFLVRRSAAEIVIRTADAGEVRIDAKDAREIQGLKLSLMPEQLLQGLTAQEAADLLAYLESLR